MLNASPSVRSGRKNKSYLLCVSALLTAILCVLAPFSLPIGPVPVSLATLAIYLSVYLLGWKLASASVFFYLLAGLMGLPVFSGFSGGLGKLLGPTGGYLIGYLPLAAAAGILLERAKNRLLQFLALLLGTAVCYAFGTAWFCTVMDSTPAAALTVCVLPFLPGDMIKMTIALTLGPAVKKACAAASLL